MKKIFTLIATALVVLGANAQTTHQEWSAAQLPSAQFATIAEAQAAGYETFWDTDGAVKYLGTQANTKLIEMPADSTGISVILEKPSYVSVGNGKYSGASYPYKLIMGMNNSTRDGLDASLFDTSVEELGYNVLEATNYLRKAADSDNGVAVYDAVLTIEVGKNAQQGRLTLEHNRGGNNYGFYVIDATKQKHALFAAPRCPDDAIKTHVSTVNLYPGRRYYVLASDKGSVELYKVAWDNVSSDSYEVTVPENCTQSWTAAKLPSAQFATVAEAQAAGYETFWDTDGAVKYLGTPANTKLIEMPEGQNGISVTLEKPSYVSVGNGKYSGAAYPYKLIMGMNNSTRDGLDPTLFDTSVEELGYNVLEATNYLRKAADSDNGVAVYDAVLTIEVGANAEQGQLILEHNRGGNNYGFYVIDPTKQKHALFAAPRCPDDAIKTHTSIVNVYPGRRYYVLASDKGSVELYGVHFNAVSSEAYIASLGESSDAIQAVTVTKKTVKEGIFNLAGQKVGADYKGIVVKNGVKMIVK